MFYMNKSVTYREVKPTDITNEGEDHSIAVWLRVTENDKLYTFHCLNCGYILFQHTRGVHLVIPESTISISDFMNNYPNGVIEGVSATPPIIIRCRKCKTQYNVR